MAIGQTGYRGRLDDGSEAAATWQAAINVNWYQVSGVPFRLRNLYFDSGTSASWSDRPQYSTDSGGSWHDITTSSSVIKAVNSAFVTDGTATTVQIGTATFHVPGEFSADAQAGSKTLAALRDCEHEYCLQIVGADAPDGTVIWVRGSNNGVALASYTIIPHITVGTAPVNSDDSGLDLGMGLGL